MSINQAAIHYNLPYSSLYGRFKRGKYDTGGSANNSNVGLANTSTGSNSGGAPGANTSSGTIEIIEHSPENSVSFFFCFFLQFGLGFKSHLYHDLFEKHS